MVDMMKENRNKKMELLTDVDMLLMIEKGITGGIYHAVHKCVKANNKYMKYYDPDLDLMYSIWTDNAANSACRWFEKERK